MVNSERIIHHSVKFTKVSLAIKIYDSIAKLYPKYFRAIDSKNLLINS